MERPDYAKVLEMADRKSLSVPTEYCFATTTIAVHYCIVISTNNSAKSELFSLSNQRSAFVYSVKNVIESWPSFTGIITKKN